MNEISIERKLKTLINAAEKVKCDCTADDRSLGHKTDCHLPELKEALAVAKGERDGV